MKRWDAIVAVVLGCARTTQGLTGDATPSDDAVFIDDVVGDAAVHSEAGAADAASDGASSLEDVSDDRPFAVVTPHTSPSCPDPDERGCDIVQVRGGAMSIEVPASSDLSGPIPAVVLPWRVSDFRLDRYEVTVARFRRFWNAGMPRPAAPVVYPGGHWNWDRAYTEPISEPETSRLDTWSREPGKYEDYPISGINITTAQAFCVWSGGRLPTFAESLWVRFFVPDGRPVPRRWTWGNEEPHCTRTNSSFPTAISGSDLRCTGQTWMPFPVGSRLPEGVFSDLEGNLSEWIADRLTDWHRPLCGGSIPRVDPMCEIDHGTVCADFVGGNYHTRAQGLVFPGNTRIQAGCILVEDPAREEFGIRCAYPLP